MPTDVGKILGAITQGNGAFKFGKGVMGKSAFAIGGLITLGVISIIWQSPLAFAIDILFAALFIWWYRDIKEFAIEHPEHALLDGAEWVNYQKFIAKSKHYPGIVDTSATSTPTEISGPNESISKPS